MKILTTSDWHLGDLFHGHDRLPEHKHFFNWLLNQIEQQQPDALLVAGDVFDNGNPSAASQSAYYEFLADATQKCPDMHIVITAGNHDSANRLEAPRPLLSKYQVEIRGNVVRKWQDDGTWTIDYDDLIIPINNRLAILAVPYLRNDAVHNDSYSAGVNQFLKELTKRARELYPNHILVMMAHMYATGADIATKDASERIIIGGQEQVSMGQWPEHPDYLTCGHIHKRQHIWDTKWARYTGSILPMSFAEVNYKHGVDLLTFDEGCKVPKVEFLEYTPPHMLRILPEDDEELSPAKIKALINKELRSRDEDSELSDTFDYVLLKVKFERVDNDTINGLEKLVNSKDAVLCKIQKIIPAIDLTTISGEQRISSIDDVLDRNPIDTLKEAFAIKHNIEMSEHQVSMLTELIKNIKNETND